MRTIKIGDKKVTPKNLYKLWLRYVKTCELDVYKEAIHSAPLVPHINSKGEFIIPHDCGCLYRACDEFLLKLKSTQAEKIINNFNEFLKTNNAFDAYYENINEGGSKQSDFVWRFFSRGHISGIIDNSFIWSNTPQGHDYWSNLDRMWDVEEAPKYCTNAAMSSIGFSY